MTSSWHRVSAPCIFNGCGVVFAVMIWHHIRVLSAAVTRPPMPHATLRIRCNLLHIEKSLLLMPVGMRYNPESKSIWHPQAELNFKPLANVIPSLATCHNKYSFSCQELYLIYVSYNLFAMVICIVVEMTKCNVEIGELKHMLMG